MKEIIDNAIEKHGRIIVAKYTNPDTQIVYKNSVTKTEGGLYILEDLTINKKEMVFDEEHINTWDFEEVKKWCIEAIIDQKINEDL